MVGFVNKGYNNVGQIGDLPHKLQIVALVMTSASFVI